jgi:vacuolar-type H+-ATPase subunit E/Vma4
METFGSAAALKRAILDTAKRESEGLLAAAAVEAESIVLEAEKQAAAEKAARLKGALNEAARRRGMMLAAAALEAGRLRAARLERLFEDIKKEVLAGIDGAAAAAGRAEVLAELGARAISRMEGERFTILLRPADMAAAGGLAAEIARKAGRGALELRIEEAPGLSGGIRVRDAEGRQHWDNSFKARLERLWPELRGRLLPGTGAESGRHR